MARLSLKIKATRDPKFSTRKYNRCPICGRPRAFIRQFGICRICFRNMALRGELRHTGVRVAAVLPGDIRTGFTAAREKCTDGADVYPAMIRSVAGMERDEQKGMDPSAIGNKLLKLSLQKRPKPLSTVGLQYKVFLVLAKLLPARTLSWLVGLLYAN